MSASIQVSFLVIVRHLRTNNEFKLRVLMYHDFTVFLVYFTYELCVSRAFFNWCLQVLCLVLQERCSRRKLRRQLKKVQKQTYRGNRRSIVQSTNRRCNHR